MRNLTADMISELSGQSVEPAMLMEADFDQETLRMWTGVGTLEWQGNEFFGGGNFLGISPIEETQDLEAKGIAVTLSGIPSNLIATSLLYRPRGRPFRLYLAVVSTTRIVATEDDGDVLTEDGGRILLENQFINDPYRIFSGLMDVMEFTDTGDTATIRLSVESSLIQGQRAKIRRYTSEDQKKRFPNDKGFDLINQLQDKEIVW